MNEVKYRPWIQVSRNGQKRMKVELRDGRTLPVARLIMMNKLMTLNLPESLDVHHRDENSLNDDIENLQLIKHADHSKHHQKGRRAKYHKYGVSAIDDKKAFDKAYYAIWVKPNREKVNEYNHEYHLKNTEKVRKWGRDNYHRHKEEINRIKREKRARKRKEENGGERTMVNSKETRDWRIRLARDPAR